jgi:hypothetical protein
MLIHMHDRPPGIYRASFSAAVLLSFLLRSSAAAQDAIQARSTQIAAAARLHPGQTVRLSLPGTGRIPGRVTMLPGGGLTVLATDDHRELNLGLTDTLWVRKTAWVPGLVIGGVLGAGFGVLVGIAVQGACEYDCPSTGEVVAFGIGTAAVGAGLGAAVGALIPKWKRSWVGGQ